MENRLGKEICYLGKEKRIKENVQLNGREK